MHRLSPSALAALLLLVAAGPPAAAQSSWESRTRTGEYAFAVGDVERAEAEFRAALEIAQRLPPPDRRLETSLGNLARLYEHEGRFTEALPMYQLEVAAAEVRLGPDDAGLLDPLLGLARVAVPTGDVPTAEAALERYRAIADATGAADPAQRWIALAMLARTAALQDRDEAAVGYQREAVAALEQARGPTDEERATAIETLAQMELQHGDAGAAEGLLDRAAMLRAADGGATAELWTAGARAAFGAGELEVAERLAERATAAAQAEGSDPEPARRVLADVSWMRVRRGTESLGDLYLAAAPGPELDLAYDRLLAVHGAIDRAAEPVAARDNLLRLASVAALRGDAVDSAHWQKLAIDLERELAGADSAEVLTALESLVGLHVAAGRLADAVTANAWLIAAEEAAWGSESPRLRPALERQLELLTQAGLKKEAKALKKRLKEL
ncbi:MAG: tetratricopeptide repeat protein [Thermoanaerobaculales bacterium]|jgi:hypothetical protein|nr:tetratricopeptide repeat protein [Thermoanaerobaculales bacterium]